MKRFTFFLFSIFTVIITVDAGNFGAGPGSSAVTSDLELTSVNVPDSGCLGVIDIVATVKNNGPDAASGFNVVYRVNGTIPIMSTFNGTVQPNNTIAVTFPNQFDFSQQGTYMLEVWVAHQADPNNGNDTLAKQVYSKEKPRMKFSQSKVLCENDTARFIDSSTHSQGIAGRSWYVGDPGNPVGTGVSVDIYFAGLSQTVGIYVTADNGCTDSLEQTFQANPTPDVAFTVSDDCEESPFQFNNKTQINSGSISQYQWNFDDGNTSNDTNPVHTYFTRGLYEVTLTATSGQGCSESATSFVEAFPDPNANFNSKTPLCEGDTAFFIDQSIINPGSITDWSWNFGNGTSGHDSISATIFSAAGDYDVSLIATSDKGCADTAEMTVSVNPSPQANFEGDLVGCEGDTLQFRDLSTISTGTIMDYQWDFKNGSTANDTLVYQVFDTAGSYDVSLTVVSVIGCSDDTVMPVGIFEKPPKPVIKLKGDTLYTEVSGVYQWYREGTPVPNATDSFLVPDQPGEYIVEVAYIECSSISDPFLVTGLRDEGFEISGNVQPNPTDGMFRINLKAMEPISGTLTLWSVNGSQLRSLGVIKNVKEKSFNCDLSHQKAGIYFIVLSADNGRFQKVWPVQKIN